MMHSSPVEKSKNTIGGLHAWTFDDEGLQSRNLWSERLLELFLCHSKAGISIELDAKELQ